MARIVGIPRYHQRDRTNQSRGHQTGEGGEQSLFFEIRHAILAPVEGGDEEVLRGVVEVAELCVHEGLHPCGDFVDSVPLVPAIGPQCEGFAVQAFLDVSVFIGYDPTFFHQDADFRSPR